MHNFATNFTLIFGISQSSLILRPFSFNEMGRSGNDTIDSMHISSLLNPQNMGEYW